MKHIPNILTFLRIVMVPVFIIFFMQNTKYGYTYATAIFLLASFTDWLDGFLARKLKAISNIGKILDPIADKLIVQTALFALYALNYVPLMVCIIVLLREIYVSFMRYLFSKKGIIVPANIWGKVKTFSQMVLISFSLIYICLTSFNLSYYNSYVVLSFRMLYWGIAIVTILSGMSYFKKKG